jgi:hypothetical protein
MNPSDADRSDEAMPSTDAYSLNVDRDAAFTRWLVKQPKEPFPLIHDAWRGAWEASAAARGPAVPAAVAEAADRWSSFYTLGSADWAQTYPEATSYEDATNFAHTDTGSIVQWVASLPAATDDKCPRCDGRGTYYRLPGDPGSPCGVCRGTGSMRVATEDTPARVRVDPGAMESAKDALRRWSQPEQCMSRWAEGCKCAVCITLTMARDLIRIAGQGE